jgi:hypothetical protein
MTNVGFERLGRHRVTVIVAVGCLLAALALTFTLTVQPAAGIPGEPIEPVVHFPPEVTRNAATITVTEGETASNSGTFDDTSDDDTDAVTVSVKGSNGQPLGAVIQDGTETGTWSWQFSTTDGPDESQTVTVTARDSTGRSSSTTFTLAVNNAPPSATGISAPASVVEGRAFSVSLAGATDPSSVDRAALQYGFDCGTTVFAFSSTNGRTCTAKIGPGQITVKGQLRDQDGANSTQYARTVTVTDDATRPRVIDDSGSLEPDRSATRVPRTTNVSATFSEEMAANTLTNSTFKLQQYNKKKNKWMTVPATITLSNGNKTATLDPYGATEGASTETPLAANKKFRGLVTTGARDLATNSLARNFVWIFNTGSS